jgi:hypothetical protein
MDAEHWTGLFLWGKILRFNILEHGRRQSRCLGGPYHRYPNPDTGPGTPSLERGGVFLVWDVFSFAKRFAYDWNRVCQYLNRVR